MGGIEGVAANASVPGQDQGLRLNFTEVTANERRRKATAKLGCLAKLNRSES